MASKTKEQRARILRKLVAITRDIIEGRNMHGLTLAEVQILVDSINQITESENSTTETFNSNVARIFRTAGYHVTDPHDCEVNYIIEMI